MGLSFRDKKFFGGLLIVTFLFKVFLAAYFSYIGSCDHPELALGYLAKASGDTFSYIGSMENLLNEGTYYFWNGVRKVYAGRMPYYGAPYFLFRLFFDKSAAADLTALLQVFFDAMATVYFARLCREVTAHRFGFWLGYVLYFLGFNYAVNAILLSTESLSLSFTVLFLCFFHRWWMEKNTKSLWAANLFLTFDVLLKPYFAPTYLIFILIYAYRENIFSIGNFKKLFVKTFLLGLPLALLIAPWFFRNLIFYNQPVPTQEGYLAGYNYTEADLAFKRFSAGWGGDITWWDAASPACYFKYNPPFKCTFIYPSYGLSNGFTREDVEDARRNYLEFQRNPTPETEKVVVGKFDHLTEIYSRERPFMFYVGSSFLRIKTMIWHTNNYNLPIYPGNPCFEEYQLLFKITQSAVYWLALIFGVFGVIWLTAKRKVSIIFVFVPLSIIGVIAFYARFAEARYLSPLYPVTVLGLTAVSFLVYSNIKNRLGGKNLYPSENLD